MSRCTFSNCALFANGPTCVSSADGSPTLVPSADFFAVATAATILDRGISMRVGALQDCPVLRKHSCTPCATAFSKSASSKMMLADLPPSSCVTRFTVGAAVCATDTPARVDPVNDTIAISGCPAIAPPTVGPSPLTKLKPPAGTSASCSICAKRYDESGANSLGLSTIVHPAAKAGATFATTWFMGQFQGVIKPHTPTGSLRVNVEPFNSSNLNCSRTLAVSNKCPRPAGACALRAREIGAPISCEMVAAISSNFVL